MSRGLGQVFIISYIFYYFWFCLFNGRDEALGEGGGFGEPLQEGYFEYAVGY